MFIAIKKHQPLKSYYYFKLNI